MLAAIMKEAASEAKAGNEKATKEYFDDMRRRAQIIKNRMFAE